MWWWVATAVIGGIVYALSEEEKEAKERWEEKKEEYDTTLHTAKKEIETHFHSRNITYELSRLKSLHYNSVQVANRAYSLYEDTKITLNGIHKMLRTSKSQKINLEIELRQAKANRNKKRVQEIFQEFKMINELRRNLFQEKDRLFKEREVFLAKVRDLNNNTRKLKLKIEENQNRYYLN
jgi:uncharacterized membrane-anchored protein YhcB (DUF1043 family)